MPSSKLNFKAVFSFRSPRLTRRVIVFAVFFALSLLAATDARGWAKILLLTGLQSFPLIRCWREKRLDYPAVILGAQFVGYTFTPLAAMALSPAPRELTGDALLALDYLLLATSLFLVTYYGVRQAIYRQPFGKAHFEPIRLFPGQLIVLNLLLIASFIASPLVPDDTESFLLNTQFLMTVLVFCVAVPAAPNLLRATKVGLLLGTVYSFLTYANLGFAINLVVIWIIQAVLARTLKPLLRLALVLVPMIAVQSVKGDFRQWLAVHPTAASDERLGAVTDLLAQKYFRRTPIEPPPLVRLPNNVITHSLHRAASKAKRVFRSGALYGAVNRAHDESLEKVIPLTPTPIPYWQGRSYAYLGYLVVPAWIWPNRADWNVWNEFGKLYGYLAPQDNVTEVVFSYYAEGYMNFGLIGVILTAILAALLFALVEKLSDLDPAGRHSFTFICFLMPLLSYQTAVCSVLSKLWFTALVVLPALWFYRRVIPTRWWLAVSKKYRKRRD